MRKFSIKTAVSAIFTAAALLGTTCFATGAATSTDSAAADDEVIINYSTQKTDDYLKFSSDNITNSGTLTAKVGDLIEVTVSAKSNDSNITKFCNGQLVTAFNTSTREYYVYHTAEKAAAKPVAGLTVYTSVYNGMVQEMAKPVDKFPWTGLGVFMGGEDVLVSQGWGENGQCIMKMNTRTNRIAVVMTNRNPGVDQKESGIEWLADSRLNETFNREG